MQTFLNLDSSDEEIILSSENDSVIQSLKKRVKYLIIYGPRKSGKTSIANNFSKVFETNLIYKLPKDLHINKETYLDINNLPTKGNDARPAISFIKFLLPLFGSQPFFNPTLPPSCKCSCPAMPPLAKLEKPNFDLIFSLIK